MSHHIRLAALGALVASGLASAAHADMKVSYYTVQTDGRDFGPVICCFTSSNEVMATLGPNGLPVFNPGATFSDGQSHVLQDVSASGELLWFTPSAGSATTPSVTKTLTTTITGNSYTNPNAMFAPNGGGFNDANGFQTAVFSGQFTFGAAQTIDFSLGADDDALLYVDGSVAVQLGGIHPDTPASNVVNLGAGTHTFELFYADRQQTGAGLSFSIPNDVIVTAPPTGGTVPEPASWLLMITGFGALGAQLRRARTGLQTARLAR